MPRTPGRLRRFLRHLALRLAALAFVCVLLFLILEVGFRLYERFGHSGEESWVIYDEDLGYRARPGHLDSNELGLRDAPIEPVKSRFRLLLLGDSIPYYGDSIDDTFPGRLERRLAEDPRVAPVEVINGGIRGYTTYQELGFLRKFGLDLQPDLVGVAFCLNDVHKFAHYFVFKDGKVVGTGYDFTDEAVKSVHSPLYALARKSRFLVFLRRRLSVFDAIVALALRGGYTFDYRPDFSSAWRDEGWVDVEHWLGEMRALGDEHGFRVFLVMFPFGEQLRQDYLARDRDYVLKPQRKLRGICERLELDCLDLFDTLTRERDLDPDLIHLTQAGRERTAERIESFLVERGLVPAVPPAEP